MRKISLLVAATLALSSVPMVGYALAPARIVLEGAKLASEGVKVASEGAKVASEGAKVASEGAKVVGEAAKAVKTVKTAEPIASATQNTGRVMADQSAHAASAFTKGHEYLHHGYKIMFEVERGGWWVQRADGRGLVRYFDSVKDAEAYVQFMAKSLK